MYKDIEDYIGMYQVSDDGKVKSLSRTIINKNGNEQYYPERLLKQELTTDGRYRVTLCKNHKTKRFLVHRLLAVAFIENKNNDPIINHIDNNPLNNSIENLEWCTHAENMIHAQKQGRLFSAQSKGGKTRGISGVKADKIVRSLIGKTIGNWTIISFAYYRKQKKYFNVECSCGYRATRSQSYITCNVCNSCIQCKTRL